MIISGLKRRFTDLLSRIWCQVVLRIRLINDAKLGPMSSLVENVRKVAEDAVGAEDQVAVNLRFGVFKVRKVAVGASELSWKCPTEET